MTRKRRKRINTITMDRISELPEDIIHHILSLIPAKDAARTSILSKTWKTLWNSLPRYDVRFKEENIGNKILFLKRKKREKFNDCVDRSLMIIHENKVMIEEFKLGVTLRDDSIVSRIDRWIELANKNQIKMLVLKFKFGNTFKLYTLSPSTFDSNSLVSLSLKRCKFTKSLFCDNTKFCGLRELKLKEVFVDDGEILLSNFPFLEKFFVESPFGARNLRIINLPSLMEAEIYGVAKVEIEAPNLRILVIHRNNQSLNLEVTPTNRLRSLTISCSKSISQSISNLISKLPFLEILELHTYLEKGLKISSIRLQQLKLYALDMDNLGEIEIDTSNLHSLYMYTEWGLLPSVFTINAPSILHVEIEARRYINKIWLMNLLYFDKEWFFRLRKHLTSFKQVDLLTIHIACYATTYQLNDNTRYAFSPVRLSGETILPLPNVKHLKLADIPLAQDYTDPIDYTGLIDALLWTCRLDILSIPPYTDHPRNRFIKFLYKELVDQEKNQDCCNDNNIKCWRHYLKGFEFVSFDGINEQVFHGIALSESLLDLGEDKEVQFELKW